MKKCLLLTFAAFTLPSPLVAAEKNAPVTFEKDVRPILKAHCFECHGEGKKLKGGLDVRLRRLLVEGGNTRAAVVPGKAQDSFILQQLRSEKMPPGKRKLTKAEIAVIERWISAGAKTAQVEPDTLPVGIQFTVAERAYWAFQPIRQPAAPAVKRPRLVRTPIDAFLLSRLEDKGLSFSAEADKTTLIRRAYLDLIGLPPTPREVDEILADKSADAYEKLIDRLLASPHYGERWGRHWLDVAGYADSEGYTGEDPVRASAWRYRDYVLRAFNEDKPFDEFIQEQLAGDEMVRPPFEKLSPRDLDKLIATGFLRMAPDGTASKEVDVKAASNQTIADTLQIVSTSLLGLTVHCAQCHNHRYDPISHADYYGMRAIFEPALDWKNWRTPAAREVSIFSAAARQKADEIEREAVKIDKDRLQKERAYIDDVFARELAKLPAALHDPIRQARAIPLPKRTAEQQKLLRENPSVNVTPGSLYLYDSKAAADLKTYLARAAKIRATKPVPEFVRALTEVPGKVPTTFLFDRGDFEQPKDAIVPANLSILDSLKLGAIPATDSSLPTTGRRLAFARSLTSGQHPLTARVLVNRLWMHHFGKGIVATPGDFGFLGERPTHPELLDWLANEFMAGGWRMKRMHRLIMTSTAYRQASRRTPELQKADPDNRLLGRMSVRRLEAEILRDAMLSVSGKLNAKRFGPPVPIMVDTVGQIVIGVDTNDTAGRPTGKFIALNGEEFRRSVYVQVRRSKPLSALETFDAAVVTPNSECRNTSTVTPQSLFLMNSRIILEQAEFLAERVRKEGGMELADQVRLAWRLVFGSEPGRSEIDAAVAFVNEQTARFRSQTKQEGDPALLALANFSQALLSANRFLYVD
jgi:mono/diheme cytochrome c family protein